MKSGCLTENSIAARVTDGKGEKYTNRNEKSRWKMDDAYDDNTTSLR